MKLHLPKLLCVAVVAAAATSALGADLTLENIVTPESGGDSYLNVGTGTYKNGYSTYETHNWDGDLTVGDTADSQGTVDKVGAFDGDWNAITPNGKENITNSLKVTGNVTVQGNGEILLGGYSPKDATERYAAFMGVEAKSMTVNGGKVDATKLVVEDLKVTSGSVNLSNTENCLVGGSATSGTWRPYSQISKNLILEGGNLHFGNDKNTTAYQSIFGSNVASSTDFSLTQTGGNMTVWGEAAMTPKSSVTQSGDAGDMIFRDRLTVQIGAGKTTRFVQDADNANLVIGKLYINGGSSAQKVQFTQNGNGLIQLAYGVDANTYGGRQVELIQNGGGCIILGGGHDTAMTGELPENYALESTFDYSHVKYTITQSGDNGCIQLKQGASISASSVTQNSTKAELSIESGAKLKSGSISIMGSLTNAGTIEGNISLNGGVFTMEDNAIAAGLTATSGTVALSGNVTFTGAVQLGSAATFAAADGAAAPLTLVFTQGTVVNADNFVIMPDTVIQVALTGDYQAGEVLFTINGEHADVFTGKEVYFIDEQGEVYGMAEMSYGANGQVTSAGSFSSVPEPATATLSLLALMGLAARRRRK